MVDQFDAAHLRIAEQAVVPVVEHEHIDTPGLEVACLVEVQGTVRRKGAWRGGEKGDQR